MCERVCLCEGWRLATIMMDNDSSWWWGCMRVLAVWAHTDAGRWHTFCLNRSAKTFSLRHHPHIFSFLKLNWMDGLFIFSLAQTLTHRDGAPWYLFEFLFFISLIHRSQWKYHFVFFWDSLSEQRLFYPFHVLFSALATINGIDGVSGISPIEWKRQPRLGATWLPINTFNEYFQCNLAPN